MKDALYKSEKNAHNSHKNVSRFKGTVLQERAKNKLNCQGERRIASSQFSGMKITKGNDNHMYLLYNAQLSSSACISPMHNLGLFKIFPFVCLVFLVFSHCIHSTFFKFHYTIWEMAFPWAFFYGLFLSLSLLAYLVFSAIQEYHA